MADKLYCAYFVEIQNIKDSFDQDETVTEEVTSSVPDAGEEAAEFLKNLGVNVDDIALDDTDSGWSDMVPVLNSKQRNTLRLRVETLKATKRLQQNKQRADVRDLFGAASIVDIPLDPPPDYDGLDTSATDGSCVSRDHTADTRKGETKERFPMGIFIPPPDYAMNDDEDVGSTGSSNQTHLPTETSSVTIRKSSKTVLDQSESLTRVDDLSRKDRKMLDALALIDLTTIFDEFNIKFSRQKAKQKIKENGVFGVAIQTLLDKDHKKIPGLRVPFVFQQLIQHLEQIGLQEEGLLRISGRQGKIKELRREWDTLYSRGKHISLEDVAVHEAAGLLKLFLRELPAPLLTLEKVDAFLQVDKIRDEQKQLSALNFLVLLLPQVNREVLHMLFSFLNKVGNEPANRMTMENIAMVLAPNLFFPTSAVNYSKPETLDYEMKLAAATSKVTLLLLTNFNTLQMVPSSLIAQIRQKHESSHMPNALLKRLGNKDRSSGDGNRNSQYSTVGMLVHPVDAAKISVTVERLGLEIKVPVSPATTASDVVQFVSRSPVAHRKKHSLNGEGVADQSFLYEVGGNIGERRLDPATNIMSVFQVNPHAKYVVRTQQPIS